MADNVVVSAGTGTTVAADEVTDGTLGSCKVQYVKIMDGTLDGTTKATVGAGGLAVDLGSNNDVTVTNATAANCKVEATLAAAQTLATVTTVGAVTAITNALPAGTNAIGKLSANSGVDIGDVDVTSCALPTGASTEATLSTLNGKVTACNTGAVVISSGSLTANAGTNLNTSALALEAGGNLAAAAASLSVMDDWDNAASDGASVSGDVAHDTADAGEPVKVGFKATTSLAGLTLVADADRTNGFSGIDGVQVVRTHCNLEDIVTGNASNTDGTSTQCIAAGAAGIKHYITRVTITNTSASNIYVEIKDGATAKHTVPVPANAGATIGFDPPLPGSAATAWNFDPSAAATTIYCSMVGFKSKI